METPELGPTAPILGPNYNMAVINLLYFFFRSDDNAVCDKDAVRTEWSSVWDTEHESSVRVRHFPVWERGRGASFKGNSFLSDIF